MNRWRSAGVALVALGLSVGAVFTQTWALETYGLTLDLPEALWVSLVTGWIYAVSGLIARSVRPDSGIGSLLVAFGLIWLASQLFVAPLIDWGDIGTPVATFGVLFVFALSLPDGHLRGWERWAAGAWLGFVTIVATWLVTLRDPYADIDDPVCCPEHLLLVRDNPGLHDRIQLIAVVIGLVAFVGLTMLLVVRWRRASPAGRQRLTVTSWSLPVMILLVAAPLLVDVFGPLFLSSRQVLFIENGFLLVLPSVVLTSLVSTRLTRARVADMMGDLDSVATPEAVETRLRETLRSEVALLFRNEDTDGYVDVNGRPFAFVDKFGELTSLDGQTAIFHDPELDREFVEAAGTAARMAISNARLQAELKAQLIEVRESRRRLVDATDEARRRVERDLHDGAQQRLVALSTTLKSALESTHGDTGQIEELLSAAAQETDSAISELRELAHGVHPAILTQAGLGPAVLSLVDRSHIPVDVDIQAGRYSPEVEATAYFFVAEGLSNAIKHSGADSVSVHVRRDETRLNVTVEDNGSGGIDKEGSGIRGLEDRVGSLGGTCRFESLQDGGTRIAASIPIEEGNR